MTTRTSIEVCRFPAGQPGVREVIGSHAGIAGRADIDFGVLTVTMSGIAGNGNGMLSVTTYADGSWHSVNVVTEMWDDEPAEGVPEEGSVATEPAGPTTPTTEDTVTVWPGSVEPLWDLEEA
jgi:hypothetical protein